MDALKLNALKIALFGSILLLSGAAFAAVAPEDNGRAGAMLAIAPQGGAAPATVATYAAPEGNEHVDVS